MLDSRRWYALLLVVVLAPSPALAGTTWLPDGPPVTEEIFVPDTITTTLVDEPVMVTTTEPTTTVNQRSVAGEWATQRSIQMPDQGNLARPMNKLNYGNTLDNRSRKMSVSGWVTRDLLGADAARPSTVKGRPAEGGSTIQTR